MINRSRIGRVLLALGLLGGSHSIAAVPVPAAIEFFGEGEVDQFVPGIKLFTDRPFILKECPGWLEGKSFLRNRIDTADDWTVRSAGVLTVLTPIESEYKQACPQVQALERAGFERIGKPAQFQLFGNGAWDQTVIFQKQVAPGERFRFEKWVVAVGFSEAIQYVEKPWSENKGELLYNGIVLPDKWPPSNVVPGDRRPAPVPYLNDPPEIIPIDVGRQLFVDDFLIESTDLKRTFHMPEKYKGNPVLKPETALELNRVRSAGSHNRGELGNAAAVPKSGGCWWDPEENLFKLWYEAGWIHTLCLATSRDGIHWERPDLDIRTGTNQVLPDDLTPDSWTVVRNWGAADPEKKWTLYMQPPGGVQPGISMTSADGIHWDQRVATGATGDRSTHFYNPFRKKWVYSLRSGISGYGRARHYYETDDFMGGAQWIGSDKVPWAVADELDPPDPYIGDVPQLYNLDAVAYESIMLGLFEIHRGPVNKICNEQGVPKITELNFAYSRDGFHWDRPDRRAHIPAERKDVWDRGYVQSLGNICTVVGDYVYFYYSAFQGNDEKKNKFWLQSGMYDRGATGVAMLRRDGFASLDATEQPGTLTTRPVSFSGKHLFVNVNAPHGALRAAVLDQDGNAIEPFTFVNCNPLSTDSTLEPVTWKSGSDLSGLAGKPVRFLFELSDGELYSFWVSKDKTGRSDGYVAGGGPGYTGATDTVGRSALNIK